MAVLAAPMPRKKRNDRTVKIDVDVARKASTIASYYERPLAEYLTELLRPIVDREFDKFKKQIDAKD